MDKQPLPARLKQQAPSPERIARGLGWFSIALGVAEIVMPRAVARACGMKDGAAAVRLYGLREIAVGIGILRTRNPAPWLWARVAGDVMDASTLAADADLTNTRALRRTGVALANVATITALDVYTARNVKPSREPGVDFPDYGDRSGFPQPAEAMRGAALATFEMPRDMRGPESLRPWTSSSSDASAGGGSADGRSTAGGPPGGASSSAGSPNDAPLVDGALAEALPVEQFAAPEEEKRQLARGDYS
jgi:hypothetical protein